MAKDLSRWLVASDIDGTLNNKLRRLPERNYKAIDRFVNECNGNFTLASGRGIESMRPHYENLPIKNTPAVIINGAGIYDFAEKKLIDFFPIRENGKALLYEIMDKFKAVELEIVTPETNYFVRSRFMSRFMLIQDPLPHAFFKHLDDVPFGRWGKVIMIAPPGVIRRVIKFVESKNITDLTFMSSSIASFEMLDENVNKGTSVLKVAQMLGIEQKYTAAIGDYFNDYAMLKAVGLSACCAQAPEKMHEIADFHACHCNKGAVADLLEYIETISD